MKNTLFALLGFFLVSTSNAATAGDFKYQIYDDTVTITGYTGPGGDVIIPDFFEGLPVWDIESSAFRYQYSLTSITIGNTVHWIGEYAFKYCEGLSRVVIGTNVAGIDTEAFLHCTNLTSVTLPNSVNRLGAYAFCECENLTNVTLATGFTYLGYGAFLDCTNLTAVYFLGNPPYVDGPAPFENDDKVIIYYLPSALNWDSMLGGRPTMLWNPKLETNDPNFGVRTNGFGFNITGTTNIPILVEACTNLADPVWIPLQSGKLTNGLLYFSDAQWSNFPARLYRIRSP